MDVHDIVLRFRRLTAPPVFPDDEEKTNRAILLNTLLLSTILFLLLFLVVAIPFVFVEKLYNSLADLALIVTLGLAYLLMKRGKVLLACMILLAAFWVVFTVFIYFSGGMTSIVILFYVVGAVIAGLLFSSLGAVIYISASCLASLAMVLLAHNGQPLPHFFPIPVFSAWVDLVIALTMTLLVMNLFIRNLNAALFLTRQRLGERKQAEQQLRESEERYPRLSSVASEGIGIGENGKVVDANLRLAVMCICPNRSISTNYGRAWKGSYLPPKEA
jgi:hypothetical protein